MADDYILEKKPDGTYDFPPHLKSLKPDQEPRVPGGYQRFTLAPPNGRGPVKNYLFMEDGTGKGYLSAADTAPASSSFINRAEQAVSAADSFSDAMMAVPPAGAAAKVGVLGMKGGLLGLKGIAAALPFAIPAVKTLKGGLLAAAKWPFAPSFKAFTSGKAAFAALRQGQFVGAGEAALGAGKAAASQIMRVVGIIGGVIGGSYLSSKLIEEPLRNNRMSNAGGDIAEKLDKKLDGMVDTIKSAAKNNGFDAKDQPATVASNNLYKDEGNINVARYKTLKIDSNGAKLTIHAGLNSDNVGAAEYRSDPKLSRLAVSQQVRIELSMPKGQKRPDLQRLAIDIIEKSTNTPTSNEFRANFMAACEAKGSYTPPSGNPLSRVMRCDVKTVRDQTVMTFTVQKPYDTGKEAKINRPQ